MTVRVNRVFEHNIIQITLLDWMNFGVPPPPPPPPVTAVISWKGHI